MCMPFWFLRICSFFSRIVSIIKNIFQYIDALLDAIYLQTDTINFINDQRIIWAN